MTGEPAPVIVRISVNNAGDPANGPSDNPSISPDGNAGRLQLDRHEPRRTRQTNGWSNVYVRSIGGEPADVVDVLDQPCLERAGAQHALWPSVDVRRGPGRASSASPAT